jgi:homoserine O-acetyltransferase
MSGFRISEKTQWLALEQPFALESGRLLPGVDVAYRTWGKLAPGGDNAVIVCHALTGSADVDAWWSAFFGPGRTLDPARDFIVCSNALGGCYGTTGPNRLAPDGKRWGGGFPQVSVRDQVRLQMALADHLGIQKIRFVLGGSMGGLQALEWALLDPERVGAVISIAAAGRHSAWCAAWAEAQRLALAADPKFRLGQYLEDDPPAAGFAAARAIAMVSYRSPQSLGLRFGRASGKEIFGERAAAPDEPAVRGWLRHHGLSLVERFDANSYLALVNAMDSHDLSRGRGVYENVLKQIAQPVLVGSVISDTLYVPAEQQELAFLLPRGELFEIDSEHGHDGFLIDAEFYEPRIRRFVERLGGSHAEASDVGAKSWPDALRFAW